MYHNDPKTSGYITAHFIAADGATFTRTLRYPPKVFFSIALPQKIEDATNLLESLPKDTLIRRRDYKLECYKFSKFGKQQIAIFREVL